MTIYKILLPHEWDALAAGTFPGTPLDLADGFVHLSTRDQVGATASRFFADAAELVILAIDPASCTPDLRWEAAGDRADAGVFPHLYRPLSADLVSDVHRVPGAAAVEAALPQHAS